MWSVPAVVDAGPIPLPGGFVSAIRMTLWLKEILAQGIRRPGSPADRWTERWAVDRFMELGITDVRLENVPLPYWNPLKAELRLGTEILSGFPLPHAISGVIDGELSFEREGWADCIAVSELELLRIPQDPFRALATAEYDPPNDFRTLEHTLPFGAHFQHVMEPAIAAGAVGFVGLLTGVPWETCEYYVPYDGMGRPIPGLWLSATDGRRVLERMRKRRDARLIVEAERRMTICHNVIATLPGRSKEWVIVASHHDAPWASAVEDATGIVQVLAQAAHWAARPVDERPHNLMFLLTAGHMAGAAGTRTFVEDHPDFLGQVVLQVHVEHLAARPKMKKGKLVAGDDPEIRWWFTSRNPQLEKTVLRAITNHDLQRSLILRPDTFGSMPTTDGAYFHPAGVPLVHFLSAPMYLFDACDTLDKVHLPSLDPVSRAIAEIVEWTGTTSAAAMRAGVVK